jgi:hypothetical protein
VDLDVNEEYKIVVDILSGMEAKKPQRPIFDPRGTERINVMQSLVEK